MLQHLVEPTVDSLADRVPRSRSLNATSGSDASQCATAAAAVIAVERDAELIVVHVRAPEVMRVGRLAPTIVHNVRLRDPHGSEVLGAARQVAWANSAFARVILISGDPVSAIVSLADELAVDLIVIGAKRSRAPAVLAARTRCGIERAASCPVRIIRGDLVGGRREALSRSAARRLRGSVAQR
jgi:nucleotide-binding universal stress UspA family protein